MIFSENRYPLFGIMLQSQGAQAAPASSHINIWQRVSIGPAGYAQIADNALMVNRC